MFKSIVTLLPFFIFGLTPLETDKVILDGKGKIQEGKYILDFSLSELKNLNGFYLDLQGLSKFSVMLNNEGENVVAVQSLPLHYKGRKTIDLSNKIHLLKEGNNRIVVISREEGKDFWFRLWLSLCRWYVGTFHSHTNYSDGKYSVSKLLNIMSNSGANFCAISDHDTLSQCYDTAFRRTGNCEPIRAIEWSSDSGHTTILGAEGQNSFLKRSVREMINDATYRGGLVQINHPCDDELGIGWERYPDLDPGIDAVEIFNGPTWFPRESGVGSDADAVLWWQELLAQGKRIAGTGNSDYHGYYPGEEPLKSHSLVYASSNHPDTILRAVKLGKVMICNNISDSRLYLYADTNNNNMMDLIMGENVNISSGSKKIKFRLEVEDADIMDVVRVFSRQGEVYNRILWNGGDFTYEWERVFTAQDTDFRRVELTKWNCDYENCTNPIYINYPDYELGPVLFNTQSVNLPDSLYIDQEETLHFSLKNQGLVSPYRFGILVAVETTNFFLVDWQREGPGIGNVVYTPNHSGFEIIEWRGGYPEKIRLSPNSSFDYWLKILPKQQGVQKFFYRSWADDRFFIIEKDPKIGIVGPDKEFWKTDSVFIRPPIIK